MIAAVFYLSEQQYGLTFEKIQVTWVIYFSWNTLSDKTELPQT